uniref:Acyl carrier protein n=1 Tax=Timspurckia oligopyrenoides TaxID=708627 RepID=A0A7S0ZE19_9RHOD|mmetsp:Transcript_1498/g.2697  ORF Transcript_1498/g.2697 Transcript_1498/m.2697 type:complete len:159 (+) Transcript_1498:78-554(+)
MFGIGFFRPAAIGSLRMNAGCYMRMMGIHGRTATTMRGFCTGKVPKIGEGEGSSVATDKGDTYVVGQNDEPGFLPEAEVIFRVLDVVRNFENVKPELVTETSHIYKDLGLDSLDAVELCMAVEMEFNIEIPDYEADRVETVTDLIDFIKDCPHAESNY